MQLSLRDSFGTKEDKNSIPQGIGQSHIPRLFKHGAISKSHPCKADMLDVQLKQSNFMTSAENMNKLCVFVLKRPNVCGNRTFAGLS